MSRSALCHDWSITWYEIWDIVGCRRIRFSNNVIMSIALPPLCRMPMFCILTDVSGYSETERIRDYKLTYSLWFTYSGLRCRMKFEWDNYAESILGFYWPFIPVYASTLECECELYRNLGSSLLRNSMRVLGVMLIPATICVCNIYCDHPQPTLSAKF